MPAQPTPVIELSQVTKIYGEGEGEVRALRGIDLRIAAGEFVAVMGPSGSGKSTCMNMLGCLDTPTSGSYRFLGVPVGAHDRRSARAAAPELSRLRLPGLQPAQSHDGARERRAAADLPARAGRGAARAGAPGAARSRSRRSRDARAEPALGRAAAACGNRARHRVETAGAVRGRADRQSRHHDQRRDHEAADLAQRAARHHDCDGHARAGHRRVDAPHRALPRRQHRKRRGERAACRGAL